MLKKSNSLTNFRRIMDDAASGKIDDLYIHDLDPSLRDFARACRRLCNTLIDQFSTDAKMSASSFPIYDESHERYI